MIKVFLQTSGWVLAHLPESLLSVVSRGSGPLVIGALPRRRRLLHSNLHHAFPDKSEAWRKKIAAEVARRLVETAMLSLASPFFSEARIRSAMALSPEDQLFLDQAHTLKRFPLILCTLHVTYWESMTWLRMLVAPEFPPIGIVFRPLNHHAADQWIKATRERFGLKLLSRKSGLQDAYRLLKNKGVVGLLIDQNAGNQGALTTLFGRVCSTSEMAGILTEKYQAEMLVLHPVRVGFWKMRFEHFSPVHDGSRAGVTLALNRWFENALSRDDNLCASWLWSHDRWRNQDVPARRFHLEAKHNLLERDLQERGLEKWPKRTRFWIRLPNWLGDMVMALPLLRALRFARPDAEITVIAKSSFAEFLLSTGFVDHVRPLPPKGFGYFRYFSKLRKEYPDTYVLFTHSLRGDLEARLTRCPQRFGIVRSGKWRPLLTHSYRISPETAENSPHQLQTWEEFFRHFGLNGPVDLAPLTPSPTGLPPEKNLRPIHTEELIFGLIAGSENTPKKRWPVEHWRQLIAGLTEKFPKARFILFGTVTDRGITASIAHGFESVVTDAAGKTDLLAFARQLSSCAVLISNDTGGMHLANALGVPIIGLFGPTNPQRTRPVFLAPVNILQPAGCPPGGGGDLRDLAATRVVETVERILLGELARI